jgi:hypothetical protein
MKSVLKTTIFASIFELSASGGQRVRTMKREIER